MNLFQRIRTRQSAKARKARRARSQQRKSTLERLDHRTLMAGDLTGGFVQIDFDSGPVGQIQDAVSAAEYDLYRFDAERGDTLIADAGNSGGSAIDTYLRVFDDSGQEISADNDSGAGNDAHLDHIFREAGSFFLGVSAADNQAYDPAATSSGSGSVAGAYSLALRLEEASEIPAQPGSVRIANHTGSDDPSLAGWVGSSSDPSTVGSTADGTGWRVNDQDVRRSPGYRYDLTSSEGADARENGWTLESRINVNDSSQYGVYTVVFEGEKGFGFFVRGSQGSDDSTVELRAGETISLPGIGSGYHHYKLEYSPEDGGANLLVDGVKRNTTLYTGATVTGISYVLFGSGDTAGRGDAEYSFVDFSVSRAASERTTELANGDQVQETWGGDQQYQKTVRDSAGDIVYRSTHDWDGTQTQESWGRDYYPHKGDSWGGDYYHHVVKHDSSGKLVFRSTYSINDDGSHDDVEERWGGEHEERTFYHQRIEKRKETADSRMEFKFRNTYYINADGSHDDVEERWGQEHEGRTFYSQRIEKRKETADSRMEFKYRNTYYINADGSHDDVEERWGAEHEGRTFYHQRVEKRKETADSRMEFKYRNTYYFNTDGTHDEVEEFWGGGAYTQRVEWRIYPETGIRRHQTHRHVQHWDGTVDKEYWIGDLRFDSKLAYVGLVGDELRIEGTGRSDIVEVQGGSNSEDVQVTFDSDLEIAFRLGGRVPTIVFEGHSGDDVFVNRAGFASSADGGGGDDVLTGGGGRDTLRGGSGDDELYGGGGDDKLYGQGGEDRLFGEQGDDHIDGGANGDYLYGGEGNDALLGGTGRGWDYLHGGAGEDTLQGGGGNDELHGGAHADELHGEGDNDELYGGSGVDRLYGEQGDDFLDGGANGDYLYGDYPNAFYFVGPLEEGEDTLFGGTDGEWDYLNGGGKADVLHGGGGNDELHGGGKTMSCMAMLVMTSYSVTLVKTFCTAGRAMTVSRVVRTETTCMETAMVPTSS